MFVCFFWHLFLIFVNMFFSFGDILLFAFFGLYFCVFGFVSNPRKLKVEREKAKTPKAKDIDT